jgi:RNA polymerase sigma-54 factor
MIRQSQQQKLLQRMSPQQIQFLKLLRVPTLEMEQRVKEELEINPALEFDIQESSSSEDIFSDDNTYDDNNAETEYDDSSLQSDGAENVDLEEYLRNESDDSSGYDYNGDNDKSYYNSVRYEVGFHQYLLEQLQLLDLTEHEIIVAEQIIGSINDDGYMSRAIPAIVDDLAFSRSIITTEEEIQTLIKKIQTFDPPGIAVYTLQESLLLQLSRFSKSKLPSIQHALIILNKHFESFIKKHYDKIKKSLKIDQEEFREAIDVILKLNPKPGSGFASSNIGNQNYILPDFFVYNNEGGVLDITLNAKNAPELKVSEGFKDMLNAYDKGDKKNKKNAEAVLFIKQKLDAAQWFIQAIKQRQTTLLKTMNAIVLLQKDFFLSGDDISLKPMILKDIAELTDLDISTVSRVANSKYVQTEFGTYSLKHFFSEKFTLESGEEVTNKEIKSFLSEIVSSEDKNKPLRDEDIADLLAKKGYNISRRTVAKYREQLMIPVARLRKE